MTQDNELVSRLRSKVWEGFGTALGSVDYANPDGPAAAARIEALVAEKRSLREALWGLHLLSRDTMIDVGTTHKARLNTASNETVCRDAEFRGELQDAFEKASAALKDTTDDRLGDEG